MLFRVKYRRTNLCTKFETNHGNIELGPLFHGNSLAMSELTEDDHCKADECNDMVVISLSLSLSFSIGIPLPQNYEAAQK